MADIDYYVMDDTELRERIRKYCIPQEKRNDPDSFGMQHIFEVAEVPPKDGYRFLNGTRPIGPKRRARLSRAVIMAETGLVYRYRWVVCIRENPTKPFPPRMSVRLDSNGVSIAPKDKPTPTATQLPSFNSAFGSDKPQRLPFVKG